MSGGPWKKASRECWTPDQTSRPLFWALEPVTQTHPPRISFLLQTRTGQNWWESTPSYPGSTITSGLSFEVSICPTPASTIKVTRPLVIERIPSQILVWWSATPKVGKLATSLHFYSKMERWREMGENEEEFFPYSWIFKLVLTLK